LEIVELAGEGGYQRLEVTVPWEDIALDYDDLVAEYGRRLLKGFRPGKVPRQVVEQRFRRKIGEQLTRQVARRLCRQALAELGTEAVGPVEVSEVAWEKGQTFRFLARFLPLPEFALPDYRSWGIAVAEAKDPQGELSLRLLEAVDFVVPDELVRGELAFEGQTDVDPGSDVWQAAARRLKLMLILKRIAREEGIEVEEADVEERITAKAEEFETKVEDLRAELEEGGGRARLKDLLLAESTLEYLLENLREQRE
jgi:FKBP-type peptidyl-prolyl cis-trans isomerase (trigger factor)